MPAPTTLTSLASPQEREADLRLFVEVSRSFLDDPRELTEVHAAEAALKEQVAALRAQLDAAATAGGGGGSSGAGGLGAAEAAALTARSEALAVENARLTAEVAALQRRLAELRAEMEGIKVRGRG